jgi:AraC-like DNA-binding protein/quercetin dioxygenase-like cupin family protein
MEIVGGTTCATSIEAGRFAVSDVSFPPERRLAWHSHPHGCIAVVVGGAVRKRFTGAEQIAAEGAVVTMPPEEPHADVFGREGARIVVVETDDGVESVTTFRDWNATHLALRIAGELAHPDPLTPLAVEGLALELAVASRRGPPPARPAKWLEVARDLLHDRYLDPPSAEEIAIDVGVHPGHLARAFRAHYGESLGGYARKLRLEWAAERLVRTEEPLAGLAFDAGFVDQSHFTRAFKRRFGLTPARYRQAHR